MVTTVPVLTEAIHLLSPGSRRVESLLDFIAQAPIELWYLDDVSLTRSFELLLRYSDCPMDLADASLVACAEQKGLTKIFTLDTDDFSTYRIKRGYRNVPFEIIP